MLKEYWYERGDEVKTSVDVKYCHFGVFIVDKLDHVITSIDKNFFVERADTDEDVQRRIDLVQKEGYKVFERKKCFRIPVFMEETDRGIDDLVTQLVSDLDGRTFDRESVYEQFLQDLSKEFYVVKK